MYQITFYNRGWAQCKLEVRAGRSADCSQNTLIATYTLMLDVGQPVATSQTVLCYRRPADPDDPNSNWEIWNTVSPDDINTPMSIDV
jgi:hypothetical protein